MRRWYTRVFNETDPIKQLAIIADACVAYEAEYDEARAELDPPSGLLTRIESRLPGLAADNMSRIGDLNSMLKHLENMEAVAKKVETEKLMSTYQRALSETVAGKYADAHDSVQGIRAIRFRLGSISALYDGISRGLEYMHFQLTNITKLKVAGLDDAEL